MSIRLASLFVVLGADGAELTKETKKGQKTLKRYSKAVGKIGANTAKLFAGVTASIAAVNLVLAANFQSNRNYIKSLEGVAAKLGDTAGNIQALQYAGEQQQIAQSAINTGLQRMTRRLSEAAQGTGEARGALQELGVDAVALNKKLPTVALDEILTRLGQVPAQADRVRIAFKLFDTEGVDFVQLIGALKDAKIELGEMGALLSDLDVSQITAADTALVRLNAATGAISTRFSVKLAPAVTTFANALFESAKQGQQLETVMDSVIRVSLFGSAQLLLVTGQMINFTARNPDTIQYGAIGFLLLGRKGAAIGAVIGTLSDEFKEFGNRIKIVFAGTEIDDLRLKLADMQAELVKQQGLSDKYPGDNIFSFGVEKVQSEINAAKTRIKELEAQGVSSFAAVTDASSPLADSVSQIGDTFLQLSVDIKNSLDSIGNTPLGINAPIQPVAPAANDSSISLMSAEDQTKSLDEFSDFLARRDQMITDSNTRLANANRQQVKIFGDTQGTWTRFAEAGAAQRFSILSGELQQTLAASSTHSKKIFKLNQIVSYANAVVSGGQAAASALATQPFFPVGLAMLSFAVLKTGAILSSIRRQKFAASGSPVSAGGSPGSISGGVSSTGGSGAPDIAETTEAANDAQKVVLNVYVQPGTSQEEIDRATAESIARMQKNDKLRSDAVFEVNVITEGVAA